MSSPSLPVPFSKSDRYLTYLLTVADTHQDVDSGHKIVPTRKYTHSRIRKKKTVNKFFPRFESQILKSIMLGDNSFVVVVFFVYTKTCS